MTRPLQSDAIIDLIFSNSQNIQCLGTLSWNLSDHIPVLVDIKKDKSILEKAEFKGRSYRRFNENDFLTSLNNKNWIDFENNTDADSKWDILYKNVLDTLVKFQSRLLYSADLNPNGLLLTLLSI